MTKQDIDKIVSENTYLKDIIAVMPGHVYWLDKNNVYKGCNDLQAKSIGLSSREEIVGKTPYDFSPKELADKTISNNNKVMKNKRTMTFEEKAQPLATNQKRHFYSEKTPLFDKDHNVVGMLGISTDITARKMLEFDQKATLENLSLNVLGRQPEKNLDSSLLAIKIREYLENIIAHMPGHVYWKNRDGMLLGCNNNTLDYFGFQSRNQYVGKTDYDIQPKKIADVITKIDQRVMSDGKEEFLEEPDAFDPERVFLTQKVPLKDGDSQIIGLLGISIDISERKRMEKELKKAKNKAEIASNAKTEFIKNMSHDIRTPLNGIMGMAQLLQMKETDPEKHQYAEGLLESSRRLTALLTEILELIRLDSGDRPVVLENINIKTIAEDVVALMYPEAINKKLKLKLEYSKELPENLKTDSLRIHRILLNLVSNALKFTQKGNITIIITPLKKEGKKLWVNFIVQDTGIGIPIEKFDAIFERFTKLSSSYAGADHGSGLGLYIAKQMVENLGGKIKVTSNEGVGSAFTCTIPLEVVPSSSIKKAAQPKPEIKIIKIAYNKKFLLIEDNKICQIAEKELLHELGCEVDVASNSSDSIALLKNNSYDIILLDIGLPDIDGITLAETIRLDLRLNTPIIVSTAHAWDTSKYKEVGINDHLRKPITLQGLKCMLKQYAS